MALSTRDPLAKHPERHPHGALAALAPDPGIALGLKLGDCALSAIRASKRDQCAQANRPDVGLGTEPLPMAQRRSPL